jgi:branched-subunit amino acid transport protein
VTAVIAFTLAAVVTFLLRSSMTLTGAASAATPPASWIALVSPAVLTAMLASALFVDHGVLVRPQFDELLAIVAALIGVRRTGNVSVALVIGLPIFWLAGALG